MVPVCQSLSGLNMPGMVGVGDPEHYCRLPFFATPNSKTCVLSLSICFIAWSTIMLRLETFGLNSQLEYVAIATTSNAKTAPVLWYAGRSFGQEDQANFACTKNDGTHVSLSSGSITLENFGNMY